MNRVCPWIFGIIQQKTANNAPFLLLSQKYSFFLAQKMEKCVCFCKAAVILKLTVKKTQEKADRKTKQ